MRFAMKAVLSVALLVTAAGCATTPLVRDRSKARIALTNAAPVPLTVFMDGKTYCWADVGMTGPCVFVPGTHTFEARDDNGRVYARRTLTLKAGESYPWTMRRE